MQAIPKNLPMKRLIGFGLLIGLLINGLFLFSYANSMRNQAIEREVRLTRFYESEKADLDNFLATAREQAGVTKAQAAAFDKIMLDAVSGRYAGIEGSPTAAQPGKGTLFSAIVEAYPNLDGINSSFARILDTISAGRQTFTNDQKKLQDGIREYDVWRKSGIIRSWFLATFVGVPTDNLVVSNSSGRLVGAAAYDKMSKVITTNTTAEAFDSGELKSQNFFE